MVSSLSNSESGFVQTFPRFFQRASRTSINVKPVTERIREVLVESDGLDLEELVAEVHPCGRPETYPANEVAAVEFIRDLLRITQEEVLSAVGVADRTFFGWKQHGRRPRRTSTGNLWPAVEVLFYLQDAHPNLGGWFHDDSAARSMFAEGRFSDLANRELDWAMRTYSVGPRPAPSFQEIEAPREEVGETVDAARRRRPTAVASTRLKARMSHDDG
jgi:hypothetical protein